MLKAILSGDESKDIRLVLEVNKEKISELKIVNDGTGNSSIGNYRYEFWDTVIGGKVFRGKGTYKNFYRDWGAWQLVFGILKKIRNRIERAMKI